MGAAIRERPLDKLECYSCDANIGLTISFKQLARIIMFSDTSHFTIVMISRVLWCTADCNRMSWDWYIFANYVFPPGEHTFGTLCERHKK